MTAAQTSPQTIGPATPTGTPSAASTLPPAVAISDPKTRTPGADFDLDEALRNALPEHGNVDWDDTADKVIAALPSRHWKAAIRPMVREWCRHRVKRSRERNRTGRSLWRDEPGDDGVPRNGKPWFAQDSVQDAIERDLDEMYRGDTGTKRLREFTAKDVAAAKLRAESTVRSGLLRVKAFTALLTAMNEHKPATVGDLPRPVLEQVIPPVFVSAPMTEKSE